MKKQWIRIFALSDRFWLEEELNKFINKYDVKEIKIIPHKDLWYASVRYEYPDMSTDTKPEI